MKRRVFLQLSAAALTMPRLAQAGTLDDIVAAAQSLSAGSAAPLRGLIPQGSEANLDAVIAAWTEMTGQRVVYETTQVDDINSRMTMDSLVGAVRYDFALPATFGIPDLVWANTITAFDDLPAHRMVGLRPEGALYNYGDYADGKRYGFQTDGDVYLMFYRRDLAERFGDDYAAEFGTALMIPDTWAEVDRQICFFHKPETGLFGGALYRIPSYLAWEYFSRLYEKGIAPFDDDLDPRLLEEGAIAALDEMRAVTEYLHPATASAGLFENWDLYRTQNIYANIGWGGSQKNFQKEGSLLRDRLSHGALPSGRNGGGAYFNWGWSYVVPRGAAQADLAYLFARFAMTPEMSNRAVREADGYFDPFNAANYSDPQVIAAYGDSFLKVHREAMLAAGPDLYLPGHGNYMASLNEHLAAALGGSLSSKRALEIVVSEWRLISLEFGRREQASRWRVLTGKGNPDER